MRTIIIIPARLESKRFPRKVMALIDDKPLLAHIYRGLEATIAMENIFIASDSDEVLSYCENTYINHVETPKECETGTIRCYEGFKKLCKTGWIDQKEVDFIVNVQCDQIGITGQMALKACPTHACIGTLVAPIEEKDFADTNTVKCYTRHDRIWWFERKSYYVEPQQYERTFKHIGVYAFRPETLKVVSELGQTQLSINNKLEQLAWIEDDFEIEYEFVNNPIYSFNCPEDLDTYLKGA